MKTPDGDLAIILIHADFKHHGKALTGTIGKEAVGQWPIDKGKVADGQVTFEFTSRDEWPGDALRLYRFELFFQHLLLREIGVVSTGGDQCRVGALLDDAALFQHDDRIRLPHG